MKAHKLYGPPGCLTIQVVSLEAELAAARIANDAAPLCDVVELLSQEVFTGLK